MSKKFLPLLGLIVLSTCCFITTVKAQNLVMNPSFEITSACPQGISQFNLATNWAQGNSGTDSCSTSDLYAGCTSAIGGANSPNGLLGYQQSRTGTHHAGIILEEMFPGCAVLNDNYREYIEGHLTAPLAAGQKYIVRFYMSLPEGVMAGTDDFGVYFSNTYYQHNACASQLMPVIPQLNYCGPPIVDTANWVEVKWIYTAAGGEQYLTIGNFKNDANTTVASINCASFNPYIYYYIDDVEVSAAPANECAFSVDTRTTKAGCPNNDGMARAIVTGCTSPFNYTWSNNSHLDSISQVAAGSYTVTVSDATNCSVTTTVTVGQYTPPTLLLSTVNSGCTTNTGSVIANVTVGTGPYTYHWAGGETSQTISHLAAGSYTVTVTGAGACSASSTAVVSASSGALTLTPVINGSTCGSSNGSATINVTGGAGPFTYNWSNGQQTQTATGLAAATYTVTVQSSTSVSPTPFYSEDFTSGGTGWTLNTSGPGANGSSNNLWIVNADASCTCGTGKSLHITCNPSGFFCFGTSGECTYFIGTPPGFPPNPLLGDPTTDKFTSSPAISTVGKTNMLLNFTYTDGGDAGNDYGLVRLSNDGGTTWTDLPTQYSDSSSCAQASIQIPSNYENIANFKFAFRWINNNDGAGNDPGWNIDNIQLISGANSSCPSVTSVTVPSSGGGLTTNATATAAGCTSSGSATANVTAGSGPYTYLWSNGQTTQTATNLAAGPYSVTITGAGGCNGVANTTVTASGGGLSLTPASTDASCGNNNGTASVNVTAGTGPYTYAWSNNAGNVSSLSALAGGTYSVTVTGAGGCSATATTLVNATTAVAITSTATPASCGHNNGTASVSITSGTAPYTYAWSTTDNTPTISNLAAGTYTVTVTGGGGCSAVNSVSVTANTGLVLNATSTNTSCGSNNGSATVTPTSGVAPYIYAWSNSQATATISNVAAGTYTVSVTDNASCSATASVIVNPSGNTPVTVATNKALMCSGDSTEICAPAGYTSYAWNNSQTGQCIYAKNAGNYYVTVTDAGNCTATSNHLAISVLPSPPVSISINGDTLTAYNSPTYQWYINGVIIPGATSHVYIAPASGLYSVQVSDTNNCYATSNPTSITVVTTGIGEISNDVSVRVYPNPLETGSWHLEVSDKLVGSKVEIFDDNGRVVYRSEIRDVKSEIDLNVASGIYMLRIYSGQNNLTRKLIKL